MVWAGVVELCSAWGNMGSDFVILRAICDFGNRFCGFGKSFCDADKAAMTGSVKLYP